MEVNWANWTLCDIAHSKWGLKSQKSELSKAVETTNIDKNKILTKQKRAKIGKKSMLKSEKKDKKSSVEEA